MYVRESDSGHPVYWNPDDEQAAEQAMTDVVDAFDPAQTPVSVDSDTATTVNARYAELTGGQ